MLRCEPEMNRKQVLAIVGFAILMVCVAFTWSWIANSPVFSDADNSATTTSVVSSCAYDFWSGQTNVYLNDGLHLHFTGNINLEVGATYQVRYRTDSDRMLSWALISSGN